MLVFDQNLANLGLFIFILIVLIFQILYIPNIFAQLQKLEVNWYALKAIIHTFKRMSVEKITLEKAIIYFQAPKFLGILRKLITNINTEKKKQF